MNDAPKTRWLHNVLLLCSLAAGTMTARMMPAYHEHVGTVTYPTRAAAIQAQEKTDRGFSQAVVESPNLALVQPTR